MSVRWVLVAVALLHGAMASVCAREVALSLPRTPLADAVEVIARQCGVSIRVEANAQKMVGPLDYRDSPVALEKLLSLLAQWAGLELRKEGEGYALVAKTPPANPVPSAPLPAPPPEAIARAKPCVALVISYLPQERARAQGTAFVVGTDGLLLTNYHVVRGAGAIQVIFPDSGSYYAAVAAHDEQKDLAVLRVAARFNDALRLGDSDQVREGDDVALTGFPMALELLQNGIPLYSSTAKATVNAVRPGKGNDVLPSIQIDAPVNPGNSGAPLYRLDTGQVVGVVQCKVAYEQTQDSGVSFAIPINLARRLIADARANSVRPPTAKEGERITASLPLALRLPPLSSGAGEQPPQNPSPAITRPFDLLPPLEPTRVPDPPEAPGLIPLHGAGGKMVLDPSRPRLYVADTAGNSLVVVDTATGRVVERVFAGSKPWGLALDAERRTLYVANSGGSEIALFDVEKLASIGRVPLSFRPFDVACAGPGRLYVTAAGPSPLRVVDLRRELEQAGSNEPLAGSARLALAPGGQGGFLAHAPAAGPAVLRIAETGRLEPALLPDASVVGPDLQDMAVSPDGERLYLVTPSLSFVAVLEGRTLRPLGQLETGVGPVSVALSPDGATAYVCHREKRVDQFDTRTFLKTGTLPLSDTPARVVASPDGKRLFVQLSRGILMVDATLLRPVASGEN